MNRRSLLRSTLAAGCAGALGVFSLGSPALAEEPWPSKPIRIVIPVAPGGSLDILGRLLARGLQARLHHSVVAENVAGAGSNLAFEQVARARPDGHTFLVGSDPLAINPALYPRVNFDPARDFEGVVLAVRSPQVLVVRNALPVTDVARFVAFAREREGALTVASQGNGSIGHLAGELFAAGTQIRFTHVPYRGGGPAVADLVGGHIDALFVTLPAAIEQIRGGQIRALAVTGATRNPALPEIPTVSETVLPGFDVVTWQGLVAPAGTPRAVKLRIATETQAILAEPEFQARLIQQGFEPVGQGPDGFTALIRAEAERWPAIVARVGAKVE